MTERELEQLAARLGSKAAETVDPERVASRVLARLESGQVVVLSPTRRVIRWVGGLAAAAMLVVAIRLALAPEKADGTAAASVSVLQELDQLNEAQLEEILQSMPVTVSALPLETVPLEDLDSTRLERLLRSLEG